MSDGLGALSLLDVREMWPHESTDFTPWLAEDENIGRLGEALGLELEVESTEVAVGPYAADILARDSGTDGYVVIENQLGRTDHDHLGKAITYASVLAAEAIVWVAADFNEEHRRAVEWLNDNTSDDVSFYAVRVELWKIDESKPALRFNVLSRPGEVARKSTVKKASAQLTDTKRLQLDWWTAFREMILDRKVVASAHTPRPQYWYNVALGRSGIHLSNTCETRIGRIGVRVYLRNKSGAVPALEQLRQQKSEIEAEIGEALAWDPNPTARDKVISIVRDVRIRERQDWPEHLEWMTTMTDKFVKAFRPRVKRLNLEDESEADED